MNDIRPHDVHCNFHREMPIGCAGCSCWEVQVSKLKDEIERLREALGSVQNGLVDLLEDQDAILPEIKSLYDIAYAAMDSAKEVTPA